MFQVARSPAPAEGEMKDSGVGREINCPCIYAKKKKKKVFPPSQGCISSGGREKEVADEGKNRL